MNTHKYSLDSTVKLVIRIAIAVGLFLIVRNLAGVLLPFVVGWFLAYLIYPLVCFVQYKLRVRSRIVSIVLSLLFIVGVLVGACFLILPIVYNVRILVHGRVIDKAQRIASIAFQPFVENFVTLKSNGSINDSEASYIENVIESSLWAGLRGQVSDIAVEVDRSVNLANTSNLPVDIKVLPLG